MQEVLNHFSLVRYIGIGIGLGANVLVRHALQVGKALHDFSANSIVKNYIRFKLQ